MSSPPSHNDEDTRFLLPQGVGIATEDVENYQPGGFHPVHLGDTFDGGRYKIVHKLGSGGFSTVWLARDQHEQQWAALKFVAARYSAMVADKTALSQQAIAGLLASGGAPGLIAGCRRQFTFDGPNGHHLCLVLPVLGPSASDLSHGFYTRLRAWLARKAGYEVTKGLADLHSHGLCHGDLTTANILFTLTDFDRFEEGDIKTLFGPPATGELETESGEATGPEAPRYIVKALDFLSSPANIISSDIKLTDFDQCFAASSPPGKMLGTPVEFLAPEVAAGFAPSSVSDVWAPGCCIFRLRSGEGPFENPFQVTSPADLLSYINQTLGDIPPEWQDIRWDDDGQPTKEAGKGKPLWKWEGERPLHDLVRKIWDEPECRVVETGKTSISEEDEEGGDDSYVERTPYPPCFSEMVWKPTVVRVDDTYLYGYDDELLLILKDLPQISEQEADLLLDLLSKIFVYDPRRRPTAQQLLAHPWFHMDDYDTRCV